MKHRSLFLFFILLCCRLSAQDNRPDTLRDPSLPDTISAVHLGSLVLDRHVISFTVSFAAGGSYSEYNLTGNGIFGEAREKIEALPSGTTVWVEKIKRKEDDGSEHMVPTQTYIIK
jgi:hypothetical protein